MTSTACSVYGHVPSELSEIDTVKRRVLNAYSRNGLETMPLWMSDEDELRRPDELHRVVYASVSLLHRLTPTLIVGGELLWGEATRVDGASVTNVRAQLSVRYLIF
jgi:hypothetical protein